MAVLYGDRLKRVTELLGRDPPRQGSAPDLSNLPDGVKKDLELIYRGFDVILAFVYLRHVSNAAFGDVKRHLDDKGWIERWIDSFVFLPNQAFQPTPAARLNLARWSSL